MRRPSGPRRGQRHPHHKLTSAAIAAMQRLRAEEDLPYRQIALRFGVSASTAYRAINEETYQEPEGPRS